MIDLSNLSTKEALDLNAKLQQKKHVIRQALKEKGVLKKAGTNDYDKYNYFSEAQYKALFTELFSDAGVELSFNEVEYNTFTGSEKQANGRMPKLNFILTDIDTGFYEETTITGEGIDKGDKAGYKAYTGALKYYLANTFMVATGDDPEKESPNHTMNNKVTKITSKQIEYLKKLAAERGRELDLDDVKTWTSEQASVVIEKLKGAK